MYKDCHRTLAILILLELLTYASCISNLSEGHKSLHKRDTLFLQPLHNGEYLPPIPIHFSNNLKEFIDHSNHGDSSSSDDPSTSKPHKKVGDGIQQQDINSPTFQSPWVPVQTTNSASSMKKEVYLHPLGTPAFRGLGDVPRPPTRRPYPKITFDIPLRKSIQVSHPEITNPAIQTTGYIREKLSSKQGVTENPKLFDNSVRETTVDSLLNFNVTEESWKPKSYTTPQPYLDRQPATGAVPSFSQYLNSKVNEHLNQTGIKLGTANLPPFSKPRFISSENGTRSQGMQFIPNNDRINPADIRPDNPNLPLSMNSPNTKYASEDFKNQDAFLQQPVHGSQGKEKNSLKDILDVAAYSSSQDKGKPAHGNFNSVGKIEKFPRPVGIEYADINIHGHPNVNSHLDKELKQMNSGPEFSRPDDIPGNDSKQFKKDEFLLQNPPKHLQLDNHNPIKNTEMNEHKLPPNSNAFSFSVHDKSTNLEINKNKLHSDRLPDEFLPDARPSKPSNGKYGSIHSQLPFHHKIPMSKIPFYINEQSAKDPTKDQKDFEIYFQPTFPQQLNNSNRETERFQNYGSNENPSQSSESSKAKDDLRNSLDSAISTKGRERRPKDYSDDFAGQSQDMHYRPTAGDLSSLIFLTPTPPSRIRVDFDSSHGDDAPSVLLAAKGSGNHINRTDNFILERKPSLLPEIPGNNKPRKPKIMITTGMLAGILIAALIFLGFLTGTMVYAFHQWKYGRKRNKGDRQKKKRTVGYTPEYLDENFAGNTYIHNNIFLPTPQSMEERSAVENDNSSDETLATPDQPPTALQSSRTDVKKPKSEELPNE